MTLKIVLLVCCLYFIAVAKTQQTQTPESFTAGAPGTDPSIFQKVEIEASFPGGIPEWTRYLMKNLHPYVPIKNKAPEGTNTIKFILLEFLQITVLFNP